MTHTIAMWIVTALNVATILVMIGTMRNIRKTKRMMDEIKAKLQ